MSKAKPRRSRGAGKKGPGATRRIVVATDLSGPAETALAWGRGLAKEHGASLVLVHSIIPPDSFGAAVEMPLGLGDQLLSSAREKLEGLARQLRVDGYEVEIAVGFGRPEGFVEDICRQQGADLCVIGTRGLRGFRHLLLGSTAQRVLRHACCPVLSVHEDDRRDASNVHKILVPTDFSPDAEAALTDALRIFRQSTSDAEIWLLHALQLPTDYGVYGTQGLSEMSFRYWEALAASFETRLREIAASLRKRGLKVETTVRRGYAPEAILAAAEELAVDLIAMGTRGRTGLGRLVLGSTAERVVQCAPCPVLTSHAALPPKG